MKWAIMITCGMALTLGLPSGVLADDDGWGIPNTIPTRPSTTTTTDTTPSGPVDAAGVVPPEVTQLTAARKILTKAQGDYDEFLAVKKAEFEGASDFVAAKNAVEEGEKNLTAIKAPLQEKLKSTNSAYASAMNGIEGAKAKLEEANASKKADEIAFRRSEVNRMQNVIQKAEDPIMKDAEVAKTQAKLTEDKRILASMQQKFDAYLKGDGDFIALSNALTNARARVVALSKGN